MAGNPNAQIAAANAGLTTADGKDWTGLVRTLPGRLEQPLRWKRPRRIFVNSLSDLFHDDVPEQFVSQIFTIMALSPQHIFQVLTKRPDRMRRLVTRFTAARGVVLGNLWLGVSVESQEYVWRIPKLLETPAAVRFVSAEPLLGPLDLAPFLPSTSADASGLPYTCLDWIICGGESGPQARGMEATWVYDLMQQCADGEVAFHLKQAGKVLGKAWGCADSHGADMTHWPPELRVREYPETVVLV